MKMKSFYTSLLLSLVINSIIYSQEYNSNKLIADIEYLSSDQLEGRFPGTKGEKAAAQYIAKRFKDLKLTSLSNNYLQNFSFKQPNNPHDELEFDKKEKDQINAINVIGYLNNNKENTIIIGAHYDHIGYGGIYSLDSKGMDKNTIHNGADDNASGVALLLNLAEQLIKENNSNNNYLFIAFSAEELGLLGSKYFVENPLIDLKNANYMINLDMVGRLNKEKELSIFGAGTSPILKQVINSTNNNFSLKIIDDGTGPSDHTSFYNKGIPVLFFNSGSHQDYHKSSDDLELINFSGIREISEYVINIIHELNNFGKLNFRETVSEQSTVSRFEVSLRVMPDYVYEKEGMKADQILKGGPADKAGLIDGDVIIKVGEYYIKDIYAYMNALSNFKNGDETTVVILRNGKEIEFKVKF
jgi:Zn-dependent M28 family amino/carboxypeptidase